MSIAIVGRQVTDGLIFCYDTFNVKSYIGEPTTNCFYTPTPDASGNTSFAVQGNGTFVRVYSGSYGGYEIRPSDVVYRYDLGATGCHYHGNDYNIPAGNYVTFTFDYFVNATGYPDTNFLANIENGGNGISAGFTDPDPSIQGVWKTWSYSPPAASTGTGFSRFLLYPGGCGGGRLATGGYILFKNTRAEFNKQHATPFVISGPSSVGTRSNTQGLLDLTGNCNIDLTNATYDSSANINFAGSNYITLSKTATQLGLSSSSPMTVGAWVYITSLSGYVHIVDSSSNRWHLAVESTGDGASAYFWNGSSYHSTSSPAISVNKWFYLVGVQEASLLKIYINGTLGTNGSLSSAASNLVQDGTVAIGYWQGNNSRYMQGKINQVSIYNRALSAEEVLKNYNATKGRYGL